MSAEEKQQKPPEEMALRDAGEQEEEEKSGFFYGRVLQCWEGKERRGGEGREALDRESVQICVVFPS